MRQSSKISIYLILGIVVSMIFSISCKKGNENNDPTLNETVTDIDGNLYHTVKIGTQVWMIENLKTTKYRNGDEIQSITENAAWWNSTKGACCDYNNDANNAITYGKLYNWHAVNDGRKIAPLGWHVPSIDEWSILINFLGGESVAGGKLKEKGTSHWQSPNTSATNETGFSGLPGGWRGDGDGTYGEIGTDGCWWSSSISGVGGNAINCDLYYADGTIYKNSTGSDKPYGFSVRCIKD